MTPSSTSIRAAAIGLVLAQALACVAVAAPLKTATPQSAMPPGAYVATDLKEATAGRYVLDADHASVIAKVSHIGYSYSVFRFGKAEAVLTWDPARPSASTLTASVDTASIETPVKDFAAELAGDKFLNSAAFPKATFVSTAFRPIDAAHGEVDGQFTLMGKTRPVTFKVALVGAGKGFGAPRIGVEATATILPQDYGLAPVFADPILLVIDAEFAKAP